jgi:hypothetical protein
MKNINPATAGQNLGDSFEKVPEPKADVGRILETMGVSSGKSQTGQQSKPTVDGQKAKIEQMKATDKIQSQKLIGELEAEMKKWRQVREEQLRKRREVDGQAQIQLKSAQDAESPLAQPQAKKKRGMLFGIGSKRVKSAQDQAQPELSGKRVGG